MDGSIVGIVFGFRVGVRELGIAVGDLVGRRVGLAVTGRDTQGVHSPFSSV